MQHNSRRVHCFCVLFCFLIMLSACSSSPGNDTAATPSPAKTSALISATPTATIGQIVAAQTCPAAGSARAAIMPPMTVENHANVVFLAQQGENTLLQRYDVTTGAIHTILQLQAGPDLGTNVSPDGQWVLFEASIQSQSAIQLVRMDGLQLQTLYCAPPQTGASNLVLSPDQHYLVFSQGNTDETESSVYLLNMRTGKLQTEMSSLQPGYPVFGQYAAQSSSLSLLSSPFSHRNEASDGLPAQPSSPLGSKHYPIYVPMKWATNSSVYLLGGVIATPSPPPQLVLLRDIAKDVTQQGSNVQPMVVTPETNNCQDVDVTPDNRQVVCSSYAQFGPGNPSSILLQSTTGGAFHSIYRDEARGSLTARAFSNSAIIFIRYGPNAPPALFKVNTDGSGLSQLMVVATTEILLNPAASYLPWSSASRDGSLYAFQLYNLTTNKQTLVFGHMIGGMPVTFASSSDALEVVGWTEL